MSELLSFPVPSQVPGSVGAVDGHGSAEPIASRTIGREEDGALSSSQVSTTSKGASSGGAMRARHQRPAHRGRRHLRPRHSGH
jgi:hypothetical protein